MCGIAGIVSLSPGRSVDPAALRAMAAQIVHRGPDDEGYYVDPQGRCGLAFRRLAIIDLAGGNQPIANENRTVWTAFNGEIYNFAALRAELQQCGHTFHTRTDTETIVHLYEEQGADCVARLHGMFALAVWDERRGTLLLARDRFGKKPLVHAVHDGYLYFASELKAILALSQVPRVLDPQALHEYLLFQYVPAPRCVYCGFAKLPPAHLLEVHAGDASTAPSRTLPQHLSQREGGALTPRRYWRLEPTPFAGSYADAKAELGRLLTAAVQKRLIADVPLGAFLSGGIDSSIVVGLMRRLGVSPLRTYSIGFEDARYDESHYAQRVAAHFQAEHHAHVVTPAAREILPTLAFHYDEPFADSSAIPTYYVANWTRTGVTVALTGDGGDEIFAGYDRYAALRLAGRLDFVPPAVRHGLARLAGHLPHRQPRTFAHRLYRFATALGETTARRYLSWMNIFTPAALQAGYCAEFAARLDFDAPLTAFDAHFAHGPPPAANQAVHLDLATYLPFDLLVKVDIASMANGLECRAPFLDHELAAFALSLPLAWRMGSRGGKHILKDWARDLLPPEVLTRRKMGFGVPVGAWLRGELRDLVESCILAEDGVALRIFRPVWLRTFVDEHLSGRVNHEHPLWALLMLSLWERRWRPTS